MSFTPTGTLYLLGGVPLDNKYINVVKFPSAAAQQSYFMSKAVHSYNDYTYMKKDTSIRVSENIENLWNVNYCLYRNGTTGKWIYCFITDKKYLSDSVTEIIIETDVYQTWLFDSEILKSFVIREHVSDDTFGAHITDEGVDVGEYVRAASTVSGKLDNFKIVVAISYDQTLNNNFGALYSGVYSGLNFLVYGRDSASISSLNGLIKSLSDAGKANMIASIFMMPDTFITGAGTYAAAYDITPTSRPLTFEGYTPKNNKLYCYPYMCLYVSTNQGPGAVYRYEFMDAPDTPKFKIVGDMSPSPSVYLMPMNYKGLPTNAEEKLVLTNFPLCSWNNDVYANWLAQNKNRMLFSGGANVAMAAGGLMTANPILASTGIMGIMGELTQVMDRAIEPGQAMGNIGGSGALSVGLMDFFFYPTTITREYAERIDQFFDMFGYRVNTLKVPNVSGRPYWNYVKTNSINIKGNVPQNDLNKLKAIYDNGVTIWHNADNVGNYSLNNH